MANFSRQDEDEIQETRDQREVELSLTLPNKVMQG